ncbi:hydrogen gas-evolving membrane-bound hydrogenase subunit E [Candidatus Oleimmundimicrobium sp.]|uniref:hydrogen gas-evolving membrane-bound hydrogenase subunit E n=1 Tax=Candidatus Oleimmundimicrobium sp. TaxID=3060597 RepID=UPI0027195434|nr:hydrogen gas-evolving membrane-bound hydrogenase subunit E [Candidatus Oleimmundimicrobium sp.]MDO8886897.1 MnhB domain-containing protein [Candidatus Oleimmundimicrobium sp.]
MRKFIVLVFLVLATLFLLSTVSKMPIMGDPDNPTNKMAASQYITKEPQETGCNNLVSAIILNYRIYDTFGEVTVIFVTLVAALAILGREKAREGSYSLKVSPSPLVSTAMIIYIPFFIIFSFYVAINGFNSIGGGFQGGIVLASVVIIYTLIFGFDEAVKKFPVRKRVFLECLAPLCFATLGLISILAGKSFLNLNFLDIPNFRRFLILILEVSIALTSGAVISSLFFILKKTEGK